MITEYAAASTVSQLNYFWFKYTALTRGNNTAHVLSAEHRGGSLHVCFTTLVLKFLNFQ